MGIPHHLLGCGGSGASGLFSRSYVVIAMHKPIIIETDHVSLDRSTFVGLKRETWGVLSLIPKCTIAKVNRVGNRVAHEIVRYGLVSSADGLLARNVESYVTKFVTNDCMMFS